MCVCIYVYVSVCVVVSSAHFEHFHFQRSQPTSHCEVPFQCLQELVLIEFLKLKVGFALVGALFCVRCSCPWFLEVELQL